MQYASARNSPMCRHNCHIYTRGSVTHREARVNKRMKKVREIGIEVQRSRVRELARRLCVVRKCLISVGYVIYERSTRSRDTTGFLLVAAAFFSIINTKKKLCNVMAHIKGVIGLRLRNDIYFIIIKGDSRESTRLRAYINF